MERFRSLDRYLKGILVLLLIMAIVFTFVYCWVSNRVGFLYRDTILVPVEENGILYYRGEVEGTDAEFSVTDDAVVSFRYGEKQYGPYTLIEDHSAIPQEHKTETMIGIEVREADEMMFRGGLLFSSPEKKEFYLFDDTGLYGNTELMFTVTYSDGTVMDSRGNIIDPMEPTLYTVIELVYGPELSSKGVWSAWLFGVVLSLFLAVSILYREEIFRFTMAFRIRNVEAAEPSDWYTLDCYIGWTILAVFIFVEYIIGLRY